MRCLTTEAANAYLASLGMKVGEWNEISQLYKKYEWISYKPPRDASRLWRFAQHAAGWLPSGKWKILQIDNSNYLDAVDGLFLSKLLGTPKAVDFAAEHSIMFEFGDHRKENENAEFVLTCVIYLFLLFEGNGYVVSSGSSDGEVLGVQDGLAMFISGGHGLANARDTLQAFENDPELYPSWISTIIARRQDEEVGEP
ncbi:MAG TPA: hypothetical protein VIR60_03665 [Gammaproteobacteria bacterium]